VAIFFYLLEEARMRAPLEILFVAGFAGMALVFAISARARSPIFAMPTRARFAILASARVRSSKSRKEIAPCNGQINDRKSSVEATKQAHGLVAWIVAQTHWAFHAIPAIRLIPTQKIQKLYAAEDPMSFRIEAFYSKNDRTIYLPDSWNPNALRDRSILLHELVHHLQYLNNVKVTCEFEHDFQAFKLQAAWLSEQGVEYPLDLMGVDLRYVLVLSHCPEY
jgi:hypothetical protein